jgi:hypothetical protein
MEIIVFKVGPARCVLNYTNGFRQDREPLGTLKKGKGFLMNFTICLKSLLKGAAGSPAASGVHRFFDSTGGPRRSFDKSKNRCRSEAHPPCSFDKSKNRCGGTPRSSPPRIQTPTYPPPSVLFVKQCFFDTMIV